MKRLTRFLAYKVPSVCLVSFVLAFQALVFQSQAQNPYTLNHNNSSATLDLLGGAGMTNWMVDGQNQLAQQWFWYRVGSSGPEFPINSINSSPVVTLLSTNKLTALYTNSGFGVQLTYTLTGNNVGSGSAGINETILIRNYTDSNLDFHFFQYSDFDLGGSAGGQSVQLLTNSSGFYRAIQTLGLIGSAAESTTPAANHSEAALHNQTLLSLMDGGPTTLNDNVIAGPGNVTWAFQWDFAIPAQGSRIISKILTVEVPEPSTFVLIAVGLVVWTLRRRGQS
jgi:hypothetical protein